MSLAGLTNEEIRVVLTAIALHGLCSNDLRFENPGHLAVEIADKAIKALSEPPAS